MKITGLIAPVLYLAVLVLSGCGGGTGGAAATQQPQPTTVVSGMASKGPISGGTVTVFAVRFGVEDRLAPIGQGRTDDGGNYSIDLGSYQGPVLVEVTGGSFIDEVSGLPVVLNAPLRAVISHAATGTTTVAVTPLTELAFMRAKGRGSLFADLIDDSNARIAAIFGLGDIVSTLPIEWGYSHERKYAAACGSFSQLVNDNRYSDESLDDALPRILTRMGEEQEYDDSFSIDSIYRINDSISKYCSSGSNRSGATIALIPVPASGWIKLSSSGSAELIAGIDLTVVLPAGVTVKADPITGEVLSGLVTISGVAASGYNTLSLARLTPASGGSPAELRIILANVGGFGPGEFVTIRFDLDGGMFPGQADAFFIKAFAAKDRNGYPLNGVIAAPASLAGL